MAPPVKASKRKRYTSDVRAAQAAATRRSILTASRALFAERGYTAATVVQIAARAGVSVDTIYTSVGRKPALLRLLVETALAGTDEVIPGEQREYVHRIQAASTARAKLEIYAAAVGEIGARMAPVHRALREAAITDSDCAALRAEISARRAANMRLFAADLRATGEVRGDLSDADVADIVWSMNAAEYRSLLVDERGWSPERFGAWLTDAWCRTLLAAGA